MYLYIYIYIEQNKRNAKMYPSYRASIEYAPQDDKYFKNYKVLVGQL